MKTLADRLLKALETREKSPADLARAIGKTESAVSQWLSGETKSIRSDNLIAVSGFLRCNPQWLVTGAGLSGLEGEQPAPVPIKLEDNPEYPAIRKVKFKLSAGASGFGVEYEGEDHDPIVFGAYWYKVNKLRPDALFAVRVANGSMEPGLHNGDIVVVNTASTEPRDGVVFAVNYEGEMVIKRLIRDEGDWWLHSDNPDQIRYKRKRMHGDCFLIGEVIQKQSMKI